MEDRKEKTTQLRNQVEHIRELEMVRDENVRGRPAPQERRHGGTRKDSNYFWQKLPTKSLIDQCSRFRQASVHLWHSSLWVLEPQGEDTYIVQYASHRSSKLVRASLNLVHLSLPFTSLKPTMYPIPQEIRWVVGAWRRIRPAVLSLFIVTVIMK